MSDTPVYIEVNVKVEPLEPFRDLFIAQLGAVGFESFSENQEGLRRISSSKILIGSHSKERLNGKG